MGCLWDFHDWCWDKYSERENADRKNFDEMKTGLKLKKKNVDKD